MKLSSFDAVYFIGIGGIGMSALASYFAHIGKKVAGYDRNTSEITDKLAQEGISIHFKDNISDISDIFKNPKTTLVIYTPAIKQSKELDFFKNNAFQILKRAEVLGLISQNSRTLAVAGTHGKTTTSSILAHILHQINAPVSAFLGGICENFNSNLLLSGTQWMVVEADEFDRSFLHLTPEIACITAVDADHLDIYGSEESFLQGFEFFTERISNNGKLIIRNGLPFKGITFGIEDNSDYEIKHIRIEKGNYLFSLAYNEDKQRKQIHNICFSLPGHHNLYNAVAAVAMAHQGGFTMEEITKALPSFKGVKRRFTYHIKTDNQVFIDDYAHHPSELNALYQALYEMYPNEDITLIFQPHLFSRTRDFSDDFAKSLAKFNRIILLDIYPARELPIEGITSEWLFDKIQSKNKILLNKSQLLDWITQHKPKILVTAGAGDISEEVYKIKSLLL